MANTFHVGSIEFSDGNIISLESDTILVVTGPNNAGKSALLSEITQTIRGEDFKHKVTKKVNLNVPFSYETFRNDIADKYRLDVKGDEKSSIDFGFRSMSMKTLSEHWPNYFLQFGLGRLYVAYLSTDQRLRLVNSVPKKDYVNETYVKLDPLQKLDANQDEEDQISNVFRSAFSTELIVNRMPGTSIHLHVGSRDDIPGYDKANRKEYRDEILTRPQLINQGDGVKSFAGILLHTLVDPKSIILLDEPEAFLHPPQIRKLASILATKLKQNAQLIVATHSDAFIQGLIDAKLTSRIKVIRISRDGNSNRVAVLDKESLSTLWSHPLLRYSELLSALFYDVAVLCEGDSDCRFFQAVIDQTIGNENLPDFRFFHVSGKDRLHVAVAALRAISVPVRVVVDIDILREEDSFEKLVVSAGGKFADFAKDYKLATKPTKEKMPDANGVEVKAHIDSIFAGLNLQRSIPKSGSRLLEQAIRTGDRWKTVKQIGRSALGNGDTLGAFDRLTLSCRKIGILINPHGELESLCRTISSENKSSWLAQVLELNITQDNNLTDARMFCGAIAEALKEAVSTLNVEKPIDPMEASSAPQAAQ